MKTTITKLFMLALLLSGFSASAQPTCIASFVASVDSTGYGVSLTNTSSGSFTNVQWSFGDGTGSSQINPTHTYNMNGSVMICLTVYDSAGSCQSSVCDTITVGNPAGGNCNVSYGYQASGLGASFSASIAGLFTQATYTWDFGDGNSGTGQFPQHTYAAAGSYLVCVTAVTASGCSSSFCNTVIVGNTTGCNSQFTYNVTSTLFNVVQFTELATGDQSWYWSFGDGTTSTLPNPMHTYAAPGTYNVCLTINNPGSPCSDTYCTNVTVGVNTTCNAMFGYQNTQMTYHFSTANTPTLQHSWSFGDGTFSFAANPSHTYGAAGTYNVCHTVTDSIGICTDTYCDSITITSGGSCNVSYTYTTDSTGTLYTFNAVASGVLGQYIWSFGDGTGGSGPSPSHQYNAAGNFIVCVSVVGPAGGIMCSYCDTIGPGNPSPCIPVFYSFADSNALGNGNVNFGIFNPCGNMQFIWDFGDGTVGAGANPAHVYADSGWYYVCVTAAGPGTNLTFCDSVYAFRLSTSIAEDASPIKLNVYPNPISGTGTVSFDLLQAAAVNISVKDIQGRLIREMLNGNKESGLHKVVIDTEGIPDGIYLLNINVNGTLYSRRISIQ